MNLTHPDSKSVVETDNPEAYLSQGWVEAEKPAPKPTPAPKAPQSTED
jgi:hypothetical protein